MNKLIDIDPIAPPMTLKFKEDFTVLGLLGPAGVGKDLVADWFVNKGFVKIAFADPMKRFVYETFDIGSETLWGFSEQRNKLFAISKGWWKWAETCLLETDARFEIIYEVVNPSMRTQAIFALVDWFRNLKEAYPTQISARIILQTLGTEWGRALDPLMWVKYGHRLIQQIVTAKPLAYDPIEGLQESQLGSTCFKGVIIPDHRFRDEVLYTQEQGGYAIRLRRPNYEKAIADKNIGVKNHASEAEMKELPDNLFDAIYELPEGVDNVRNMLEDTYSLKLWAKKRNSNNESEPYAVRYHSIPAPKL